MGNEAYMSLPKTSTWGSGSDVRMPLGLAQKTGRGAAGGKVTTEASVGSG